MKIALAAAVLCGILYSSAWAGEVPRVADTLPVLTRETLARLDAERHLAAVALSEDDAPVTVRVAEGPRPVVLVLMALTAVEWRLEGALPRLKAVVVVDHYDSRSLLAGLPEGIVAYRTDPRFSMRHTRQRECSAAAPRSPGGQCLDPAFHITAEQITAAAVAVTGDPDGFASLAVGSRSRRLDVPGRAGVGMSLGEARDLLATSDPRLAGWRDRLAALGNHPGLTLGKGGGQELHMVEAGPCLAGQTCSPQQKIIVPPTGRPIVLALRANRDLTWSVETEYGAQLAGIALLGGTAPLGLQAPADLPVTVLLDDLVPGPNPIAALMDQPERDRQGRRQRNGGGWERLERYLANGQPVTLR